MATVYVNPNPPNAGQLHVFAIGVGRYPHIAACQNHPDCPPVHELAAPPTSVKRLAEWLILNEKTLSLPLGSIEVSTSDTIDIVTPQGTKTSGEATLPKIKTAFDDWYNRCDGFAENIALFYFCGHGLTAGQLSTLLLTSDFFESPLRPFENCIRLESTMLGMTNNRARCQLFLADCCRTSHPNYTPQFTANGITDIGLALKNPKPPLSPKCSVVLFAAQNGAEAFAPASAQPTPFVELFLEGIENGACAAHGSQKWFVSPATFFNKAVKLAHLQRERMHSPYPADPAPQILAGFYDGTLDASLRNLAAPPQVPTRVFLLNSATLPPAALEFRQGGQMVIRVPGAQWTAPDEVNAVLPGGDVEISIVEDAATVPPVGLAAMSILLTQLLRSLYERIRHSTTVVAGHQATATL